MNYSLKTLEIAMSVETDQASMEGHFDNLLTSAKNKLSTIFNSLKSVTIGNTNSAELAKLDKNINFMDVKAIPINVTPNFSGDMGKLIGQLELGVNLGGRIKTDLLIPARKYFEKIIGSPELLSSFANASDDPLGTSKFVGEVRGIKDGIAEQHSAKFTAAQVPFSTVYRTIGEFNENYLKGKALLARCTTNTDLNPVEINKEVEKVNAVLEKLQQRMKTDPAFHSNVDVLRSISGVIFDIATMVEFYAGIYQLVNGVNHGHLTPTYSILESLMKNK